MYSLQHQRRRMDKENYKHTEYFFENQTLYENLCNETPVNKCSMKVTLKYCLPRKPVTAVDKCFFSQKTKAFIKIAFRKRPVQKTVSNDKRPVNIMALLMCHYRFCTV